MGVLGIQKGAAYKRMNGETALTVSEMADLASHFNISLDAVFQSNRYISFINPFLNRDSEKLGTEYFMEQFTFFTKPLSGDGEKELYYMANELPIFYYFAHRNIFHFVLSIWNHMHWESSESLKIRQNLQRDVEQETFRNEILDIYYNQPVTEIWNSNMLNNLYQQIIFCITIRAFEEKSMIEELVSDIKKLINQLKEIAVSGVKKNYKESISSEAKVYLNEFGNYLNILMYKRDHYKGSFIGFDFPQFILSFDPDFFNFSMDWFQKIKSRSILISGEGLQYRELFFKKMEEDYLNFTDRAEKLMNVYY